MAGLNHLFPLSLRNVVEHRYQRYRVELLRFYDIGNPLDADSIPVSPDEFVYSASDIEEPATDTWEDGSDPVVEEPISVSSNFRASCGRLYQAERSAFEVFVDGFNKRSNGCRYKTDPTGGVRLSQRHFRSPLWLAGLENG